MKNKLFLFLSFGALLCSCNSSRQASYAYSSTYYPPYTPSSTTSSSSRPATTSSSSSSSPSSSAYSPTPTANDVTTLRNYLMANGTYIDGTYAISKTTRIDANTTSMDMIYYDTSDGTFSTLTSMTIAEAGVGEVRNLGGVGFDLTSFSTGMVVGSTVYAITSGTTRTNAFVFYPTFNAYPSFSITRYTSTKTEYASTVSNNVELCAACATRAINNLIKSLPSMGVYAKLW